MFQITTSFVMSHGEILFFLELVNTFVDRKYNGEKKFSTVKSETKAN